MFLAARLTVNGTELPITGATYTEPSGALGASLAISLARPEVSSVPPGASIKFEILVGREQAGVVTWSSVTLLDRGKLAGRNYRMGWQAGKPGRPTDTLNFSALNLFADRWGLAPARPVIMYDPDKVDGVTLSGDERSYVKDEITGAYYTPVLEPIAGLSLRQIIDRAYTKNPPALDRRATTLGETLKRNIYQESLDIGTGAGFDRVVTNLPNFPVERTDFTLDGGWHAGAAGYVSIFEPLYFEDSNILFIIDPSRGLPSGFTPRTLPPSCVVEPTYEIEARELINAMVLAYKTRTEGTGGVTVEGHLPSKKIINDPDIITGEGEAQVTVKVTHNVTEWTNLQTGQIDYTNEDSLETRTYGYRKADEDAPAVLTLLSEEIVETDYQFSGKLKVGHNRRVSAVYRDPNLEDAPDTYGEVFTEVCRIEWRTDFNNPGESVMLRSITDTEGVVLVEEGTEEGRLIRTPILEAARAQDRIRGDGTQYTERKPIKTFIEQLIETGVNQAHIQPIVIDHLAGGVPTPLPIQSRTGSRSTASFTTGKQPSAATVIRELIRDEDSIALYGLRRVPTLDIGELDPVEGRKVVKARLKRVSSPRQRASISIPGIDFALRRGSVVIPPLRTGFNVAFLILSRTITLRGLAGRDPQVNETLEAIELG
jgi:hypothetical protein